MTIKLPKTGAPHAPPRTSQVHHPAPAHRPKPGTGGAPPTSKGWTPAARRPPPPPPPPDGSVTGTAATTGPAALSTGRKVVNGVTIEDYGASPKAQQEAEAVVKQVANRADIQQAMFKQKVTLVIIPADKKMTDLPEFASLKGKKTFDGRVWDDVRGSGGTRLPDGRLVVGVCEENLAKLPSDSYGGNYSVTMHELAHSLQNYCLPKAEAQSITQAYEARKAAGGPWTEQYGSSNEMEYFAQGTNAWFGRNNPVGQNGAAWVKANDPALAAALQKIYGDPP